MSTSYLRHSRRPSQRVIMAPPSNSIDAILAPQTRTSHQLFKTQILNNIASTRGGAKINQNNNNNKTIDLEPLPELDYHLLYILINLAKPHLGPRDLKRYDYLAEARKYYFIGLSKFQDAYKELLAANTYGKILEEEFDELSHELNLVVAAANNDNGNTSTSSPEEAENTEQKTQTLTTRLARIEISRRANNEDLRQHLLNVEQRAKARDCATVCLSSLKLRFLQTEVPGLIDMGKQIYAYRTGKSTQPPQAHNLPPPKFFSHSIPQMLGLERAETGVSVEEEEKNEPTDGAVAVAADGGVGQARAKNAK